MSTEQADTIWTLGHSTRSIDEFITQHYRIEALHFVGAVLTTNGLAGKPRGQGRSYEKVACPLTTAP